MVVPLTLVLPALFVAGAVTSAAGAGGIAPSATALEEIPADYLPVYLAAPDTHCPGLPWTILAAIGWVETRHGTLDAPGVMSGENFAGAAGPMQFGIGGAAGNTWGGEPRRSVPPQLRYGVDGNGDGVADAYDHHDAIPAAAAYLCDHGAPADIPGALYAYNHSWDGYVTPVLEKAAEYGTVPLGVFATGGLVCPVLPPVWFTDTWHAPRDGGARLHKGQDLFAAYGQPLLAITDGTVTELRTGAGNGGTILWLVTDFGAAWYYAHLSAFAGELAEGTRVRAGAILGYNGNTGNAATTPPHLHIQYRPAGRRGEDVNSYAVLDAVCPQH